MQKISVSCIKLTVAKAKYIMLKMKVIDLMPCTKAGGGGKNTSMFQTA